jgi:nitrous oxidase accessory protein NosD
VALAAARPGDVLTVTGRHVGNFVVSKALSLRAGADGMIDGGGAGSALLIEADNVAVEGLTITRSGQLPSADAYEVFWGPSGVHVRASRAWLTGLTVTGNDWGIVVLGREKCEVSKCVIEDNRQDGVKILGGRGHLVAQNRINRNGWGVRLLSLS